MSLSTLQSDAIFVLSGTKNDIAGQKTISREISFLYHRVIAQIKAQVCDKVFLSHALKSVPGTVLPFLYSLMNYEVFNQTLSLTCKFTHSRPCDPKWLTVIGYLTTT